MINKPSKSLARIRKHVRVRKKVKGTSERPRLNVYRSLNHIYAQIIDDKAGNTIVAASTLDESLIKTLKFGANKEAAKAVGSLIAEKAKDKGIIKVVFDRGGYLYHGRIKELAEAARAAGLEF